MHAYDGVLRSTEIVPALAVRLSGRLIAPLRLLLSGLVERRPVRPGERAVTLSTLAGSLHHPSALVSWDLPGWGGIGRDPAGRDGCSHPVPIRGKVTARYITAGWRVFSLSSCARRRCSRGCRHSIQGGVPRGAASGERREQLWIGHWACFVRRPARARQFQPRCPHLGFPPHAPGPRFPRRRRGLAVPCSLLRFLRGGGRDAHPCSAAAPVLIHFGVREAVREAAAGERGGLFGGPAVTGEALSARSAQPFDGH